jgi:hypothetical protein
MLSCVAADVNLVRELIKVVVVITPNTVRVDPRLTKWGGGKRDLEE